MPVPQIRVDCTDELLYELYRVREAYDRTQRRTGAPKPAPQLDTLIVQIIAAQRKRAAIPKLTVSEEPANGV